MVSFFRITFAKVGGGGGATDHSIEVFKGNIFTESGLNIKKKLHKPSRASYRNFY